MNNFKRHNFILVIIFLLAIFTCGKKASTVNPGDYTAGGGGGEPGYSYPYVTAIYPAHLSTEVPLNSNVTILFNIPVDIDNTDITITATSSGPWSIGSNVTLNTGLNYAQLVFTGGFDTGETIYITTTSGIVDSVNGIALYNPQTYQFDVSTYVADITGPWDTGYTPTTPPYIAVNTDVTITFNETVDPSTVNSNTFYLTNVAGDTVAGTITNVGITYTLNPANDLLMSTPTTTQTYTAHATAGIKDMSGNSYTGTPSWTFTTVFETDAIAPSFSGSGPSISYITGVSAEIKWTTNEPTDYSSVGGSLRYGTGTDLAETPITDPLFTLTHAETLSGLTAGARYYYQITFADEFGNSTTSSIYQFNTQTPETPTQIDTTAMLAKYIPQKAAVANSGAFVFWYNGTYHINAALYTSGFAQSWTTGVFPNDYRYLSAVEDGTGGVIILASNAGTGVYAKRLSGGSFGWGYVEGDAGLPVDTTAGITKASAAPVYSGFFSTTVVSNRTTDMDMTNAFFDFGTDFSGVDDNDIAVDTTNHDGTVVTLSNYRYALSQTTAGTIISGNAYRIVDGTTDISNDTAEDHSGISAYTLTDGTPTIYSSNPYTTPAWVNWGANGDFIRVNTTYARLDNRETMINLIDSGNADTDLADHLIDTTASWGDGTGLVAVNYIATETVLDNYARISVVTNTDLTLADLGDGSDIFPLGTEPYEIYDEYDSLNVGDEFNNFYRFTVDTNVNIDSTPAYYLYNYLGINGTADTPPANPLYDDGYNFVTATVAVDDIVFNSSTGAWTYVTDATTYAAYGALGLNANIMSDGDTYSIFRLATGYTRSDIVDNGRADLLTTSNVLYDNTTVAAVGDIVYNVTDGTYSVISLISAGNYYRLAGSPGFAPNEGYIIVHPSTTNLKDVLYAWEEGTAVHWRIYTLNDSPPTAVNTEQTIANAQNPHVITNSIGNAFIIYESTNNITANRINAAGTSLGTTDIDTVSTDESILKVIDDNAGGFVILYRRNPTNLRVQRINSAGTRQWGTGGRAVGNPANIDTTTPVSEAVDIVYDGGNDVIVAVQINTNIWAARIGTTSPWAGYYITDAADAIISTTIQQKPKIYIDAAWGNARIVWEDNRFVTGGGYGIFGQQIAAGTGARAWDADNDAANDMNGVAVVLNADNGYWPNLIVLPYNNNASANIIWDDWRTGSSRVVYRSLSGFTP